MLVFQVETFAAIEEEVKPLWEKHWRTSGVDRAAVPLNPNVGLYRAACENGGLHIVTARRAGKLIGYFFNFLLPSSLHYSVPEAHSDIYYIDCDDAPMARLARYRAGIRFMERALQQLGVVRAFTAVKDHADIGRIWTALGWKAHEQVYYRRMGA